METKSSLELSLKEAKQLISKVPVWDGQLKSNAKEYWEFSGNVGKVNIRMYEAWKDLHLMRPTYHINIFVEEDPRKPVQIGQFTSETGNIHKDEIARLFYKTEKKLRHDKKYTEKQMNAINYARSLLK